MLKKETTRYRKRRKTRNLVPLSKWRGVRGEGYTHEMLRLASSCPYYAGAVVYSARALYNVINANDYISFGDNCDPVGAYKTSPNANNNSNVISAFNVTIYPNPSGGKINIDCSSCSNNTSLQIEDATGKVVLSKNLHYANGERQLDLPLARGMYIVTITNNDTHQKATHKLVID